MYVCGQFGVAEAVGDDHDLLYYNEGLRALPAKATGAQLGTVGALL